VSRKQELQRIESVLNFFGTKVFLASEEFPVISLYVGKKYPGVDISHVKTFRASGYALDKEGFLGIGGLYIEDMKTILIRGSSRSEIGPVSGTILSRFNEQMKKHTFRATQKDYLMHEMFHAVSAELGRSSRKFLYMEEEFAYVNCIDFYRQTEKKSEEKIISSILPFALQSVLNSREGLLEVLSEIRDTIHMPPISAISLPRPAYFKLIEDNAYRFVKTAAAMACKKAKDMIEHYDKNGCMFQGLIDTKGDVPRSKRFAILGDVDF